MSLYKAIEHKKEKRKQYEGAKAISRQCRNHGNCLWCYENRLKKDNEKKKIAQEKIKEYKAGVGHSALNLKKFDNF